MFRDKICRGIKGKSLREIARLLGRNVSSTSREIMRNKTFMNAKSAYSTKEEHTQEVVLSPRNVLKNGSIGLY